jgi:hypothetical protein
MSGLAELADEVEALRAEVRDLREALRHALEIAEHERRARARAEDIAARAWRVVTTWPRRADHPGAR